MSAPGLIPVIMPFFSSPPGIWPDDARFPSFGSGKLFVVIPGKNSPK
jgi:hypothetical protein